MENICYIIGAADTKGDIILPRDGDYVIAADGGYASLEKMGITPDLTIGDFDSLEVIPDVPGVIRLPAEKDDTDTMLAVNEGLKRGYKRFIIYGGIGGRLDHTLANIQTLIYLSHKGASCLLVGEGKVISAIENGGISLSSGKKGYISVFAATGDAYGVDIIGLKYQLSGATISCRETTGVSNEFTEQKSSISVRSGTFVILWYEDYFSPDSISFF